MIPLFANRRLLIATKHEKERVIAPILEQELGVRCFVDDTFDTDQLGTFTGEIERQQDPVATVREKCLRAMRNNFCDLGVASEGSFGPHPSLYFVCADDEFLILIDTANDFEILVRTISTATNFNGKAVRNHEELMGFAAAAGFPDHGLILRPTKDGAVDIHKGITDASTLKRCFDALIATHGTAYVETDMRAMFNPSRMKVIETTAEKLVQQVRSTCPECALPGFRVTDIKQGLPCSLCGLPTRSTLSHVYQCQRCGCTKEERYPHQKTTEDPMYCDHCNP